MISLPNLPVVSAFFAGGGVQSSSLGLGSTAWPSNNLGIFFPFIAEEPVVIARLWWYNGTAVAGTNVDVGIYSVDGTRLVSTGSTAASGTSAIQSAAASYTLDAGQYWFAMSADSTGYTNVRAAFNTATELLVRGTKEMASAFPLPATATFADAANNYVPFCGFATRSFV